MAPGGNFHQHVATHNFAWDEIAHALWKRYPNPYATHVLSEDTITRRVEGPRLITKRLLSKVNRAPRWMERFTGDGKGFIVEESIVDREAKTFTTYTRNINFTKLMTVVEKCTYYVSPENEGWTCCLKQAWLRCSVIGISRPVEKFSKERYKKNAKRAELGLEHIARLITGRTPLQ